MACLGGRRLKVLFEPASFSAAERGVHLTGLKVRVVCWDLLGVRAGRLGLALCSLFLLGRGLESLGNGCLWVDLLREVCSGSGLSAKSACGRIRLLRLKVSVSSA
ncbi:unnamed protein product [Arabidopsis halleri]